MKEMNDKSEKESPLALNLEVDELEKGRRPGGCFTSSSTSPLCTCICV